MRSTLIPASQLLRCVVALVTPSTTIVATVQRERAAGVRSHREHSAEVEHAQPAEVARRDAGHGEDVAGGEARGDDAEEDAAGAGHLRGTLNVAPQNTHAGGVWP